MKTKLNDGYEVEVNETALHDWQFVKMIRKIDRGDAGLIVDVAEALLGGEEEVDKLAEHLSVNGYTSSASMVDALTEIMESVGEAKNS